MAAGSDVGSASRELLAPRRTVRAPLASLFNEKEYFYRARVLRRARKEAALAGRQERFAAHEISKEIAALAARCDYLEGCAAFAHHHAAHLHERVCQLEAAARPSPAVAASPPLLPLVPTVGSPDFSAPASTTPSEAVAQEDVATQRPAARPVKRSVSQPAVQQAQPSASAEAGEDVDFDTTTQTSHGGDRLPDTSGTESREAAEPLPDRLTGRWAVLQGLQKSPQLNGRLVRVGSRLPNGRYETMRPGSRDQQAVRLDNMRELLETYGGCAAGDEVPIDDGVLVLLGFDPVEAYWACKKANMYIWVPERNFT